MGNIDGSIVGDYGYSGLGERILSRLRAFGVDTAHLTQEAPTDIDHVHGRG